MNKLNDHWVNSLYSRSPYRVRNLSSLFCVDKLTLHTTYPKIGRETVKVGITFSVSTKTPVSSNTVLNFSM